MPRIYKIYKRILSYLDSIYTYQKYIRKLCFVSNFLHSAVRKKEIANLTLIRCSLGTLKLIPSPIRTFESVSYSSEALGRRVTDSNSKIIEVNNVDVVKSIARLFARIITVFL